MSWLCRFGIHKWSNWYRARIRWTDNGVPAGETDEQKRRCERCNLEQFA